MNIATTPAPAGETRIFESLESIGPARWNELWARSEAPTVFARYEWALAWWQTHGKALEARIYTAWDHGKLIGLLPAARRCDGSGKVGLVGEWHADYAPLLADRDHAEVFETLLNAACADLSPSESLVLADVRSDTRYAAALERRLQGSSSRWTQKDSMVCPRTGIEPARLAAILGKDSLKRHSRKLRKMGNVEVWHHIDAAAIEPRLDRFFSQHVARWAGTGTESLFSEKPNREFYRGLVENFSGTGQLVFTEVALDGRPVAFHLGFVSEGDFLWYKPTFDPELAKVSPGEVLLRELFIWAGEHELEGFDFTRGGEAFKLRFAEATRGVATYTCHGTRRAALLERQEAALKSMAKRILPAKVVKHLRDRVHARRAKANRHGS